MEVLDDLVGTGDQHREIGRMGFVEPPVVSPGSGARPLADADQPAVREHLPVLPDGGEQLESGSVRRMVHRGIPVPRSLGKRKGVDELGVGVRLGLEIQSEVVARRHPVLGGVHVDVRAAVVDLKHQRLALRKRGAQRDGKRATLVGEVEFLAAGADRTHLVGLRIEFHFTDVGFGLEADFDRSVHALRGLVQIERDPVVEDVEGFVAQFPDRPVGAVLVGGLDRGWLVGATAETKERSQRGCAGDHRVTSHGGVLPEDGQRDRSMSTPIWTARGLPRVSMGVRAEMISASRRFSPATKTCNRSFTG